MDLPSVFQTSVSAFDCPVSSTLLQSIQVFAVGNFPTWTSPQLPPRCNSYLGQHSFALYSLALVSSNLGLLKQELVREVKKWCIFIFLHFTKLHTWNSHFPFCFWLATNTLYLGSPGAVTREETNGASLGNKGLISFPEEFQGFVHAAVLTLPHVCTTLRWVFSDNSEITIDTVWPGFYCYLYSWFPLRWLWSPYRLTQLLSLIWKARGEEREKGSHY